MPMRSAVLTRRSSRFAVSNPWSHSGYANGVTDHRGCHFKQEEEAAWLSVTPVVRSLSPLALTDLTIAVAATDTGDNSTVQHAWGPMRSGVYRPDLWMTSSFVGGVVAGSSVTDGPAMYYMRGTRIPLASVPRTDVSGARPILLAKLYQASSNVISVNVAQSGVTGDLTSDPKSRMRRVTTMTGVDVVSNLETLPASAESSKQYSVDLFFELEYVVPVFGVPGVGNSITDNYGMTGWLSKMCYALSTPQRPIVPLNLGRSACSSATYTASAMDFLDLGLHAPGAIYLPCFTPNEARDIATADARHARYEALIARGRALGSKVVLWDSTPNDGYDTSQDDIRIYSQTWAQAQAAAGHAKYARMGRAVSTGAYPDRYANALWHYDSLHPSEAGADQMYPVGDVPLASFFH